MPEKIRIIAAFKLLKEYFKEQPKKIMLYASTFMIPYCYIQIQNILFYPYNEGKRTALIRIIIFLIASLLFYLIVPRKNPKSKRNPLIIGVFSGGIILETLLFCHLELMANHATPLLLQFLLGIFTKELPFGLLLYLFAQMAFNLIEKKELTIQKVLKYSPSILPVLGFFTCIHIIKIPQMYAYRLIANQLDLSALKISPILYTIILNWIFWIIFTYFFIRIFCAPFLMIDRNIQFLESVKTSWKMTRGNVLRLFVPYAFLAFIRFCLGVIPAIPLPFFQTHSGIMITYLWSGFHFFALPIGFTFATLCYRLLSNAYFEDKKSPEISKKEGKDKHVSSIPERLGIQ